MKLDWHTKISFLKSTLRIFAGIYLVLGKTMDAGVLFMLAEALGIIEEL